MSTNTNSLGCRECGAEVMDYLPDHLVSAHGMTEAAYLTQYPGAPTISKRVVDLFANASSKITARKHPKLPTELTIVFAGIEFPVNSDVSEDACLPLPDHYRVPKHGPLGTDVQHVAISLKNRRSGYLWGMPGTGKDALIHAWSYYTRSPAIIRQIQPGSDIESWFFSRGFTKESTIWEEGEVLKALRDGYTTATGRVLPYALLVTDFDRAERDQAEHLRLITDTTMGRVTGPAGKIYRVVPGTIVMATANTAGGGDERGRMTSSNPLDASLLDRFERKLQFHWLSWEDEGPIVRAKFPELFEKVPTVEKKCQEVTKGLRTAILNGDLHTEFSHRALCNILSHAQDILREGGGASIPTDLLARGARIWLDGLPDEDNRLQASRITDAHFDTLNEKANTTTVNGKKGK